MNDNVTPNLPEPLFANKFITSLGECCVDSLFFQLMQGYIFKTIQMKHTAITKISLHE